MSDRHLEKKYPELCHEIRGVIGPEGSITSFLLGQYFAMKEVEKKHAAQATSSGLRPEQGAP